MAIRNATAHWEGNLKEGSGRLAVGSGAFEGPYSFISRFEGGNEVNPEELLGAAHAGCFSMQMASTLSGDGFTVNSIDTTAKVRLERVDGTLAITRIDLSTTGDVDNIDEAAFQKYAETTKDTCIVSRALSAVPMTVEAKLA
jgi:lipoyl-dependent peroxiredoxin